MKFFSIFLLLTVFTSIPSYALELKGTCVLQANRWYDAENLQLEYKNVGTIEECQQKAEDLFNSIVHTGSRIINPIKNTITERNWTIKYKRVQSIFYEQNGVKFTKVLKRKKSESGPVSSKTFEVVNAWRCWKGVDDSACLPKIIKSLEAHVLQ